MASEHRTIGSTQADRSPWLEERDPTAAGIATALNAVRRHLGMDVGFISEFVGDERVFQYVSSAALEAPIRIGQRLALSQGYCKRVVDGKIPPIIPDTATLPFLKEIPDTQLLPIGSHLSVPIRLSDGTVYGTICCFSHHPKPSLNDRDLSMLKLVAELVSTQIETSLLDRKRQADTLDMIRSAIVASEPNMVYQPVFELTHRSMVGAEALSRFSNMPYRSPDLWFEDARHVGLRGELEMAAIRNAVDGYLPVWQHDPALQLAVNTSAETLCDNDFLTVLGDAPLDRITIEITEHDQIGDYDLLERCLAPLRRRGIKVAVDDAGSGYASLRHILRVRPDIIKLDISLTRNIDRDPMQQALAAAVVQFSSQTNSSVLAEGLETEAELASMTKLGAKLGQGFLLGKPSSVGSLVGKWVR